MGNDESTPIDDSVPPQTLSSRSLEGLAEYIKDGRATKIVVLSGAGISTSAGIPDFRSPETGLYANLAKLNLPFAEAVFDMQYFRQNPHPFYKLAHELYPGKFRPTITHSFIRLLHEKRLLLRHFTQNIDCLDREAGVPPEKIVEAHGSFAKQSCIDCNQPFSDEEMREHVANQIVPHCKQCNGLVKPEIVFFGEKLPSAFFESESALAQADLLIVMGSSLTVQPFASLPYQVLDATPRVLINLGQAGDLGSCADDVLLLGDCDSQVRQLAEACGWLQELEALWAQTAPDPADQSARQEEPEKTRHEQLEDEVDKLTREIDESLRLSKLHDERVRKEIDANNARLDKADSKTSTVAQQEKPETSNTAHITASASANTSDTSAPQDLSADTDNDKPKI